MPPFAYAEVFAAGGDILTPGRLHLPTGRVVACDPYFCASAVPFARHVPPGNYDVQLYRVHSPEWGRRIALARILLQPHEPTVAYEKAICEGSDSGACFVDSGVGSFMDEATRAAFAEHLADYYRAHPRGNYYTDVLEDEFKRSSADPADPEDAGSWTFHLLRGGEMNLAIFSSGLGDGHFESHWGLTRGGEPTFLVTDFNLLGPRINRTGLQQNGS